MSAFLAKRFPDRFQLSGDAIHNRATGESFPLHGSDMHPLEAASYLVQVNLSAADNALRQPPRTLKHLQLLWDFAAPVCC